MTDAVEEATREQLVRLARAARWYVINVIDGARTDTAWFELEAALVDIEPEEFGEQA